MRTSTAVLFYCGAGLPGEARKTKRMALLEFTLMKRDAIYKLVVAMNWLVYIVVANY